jgi:hypothetical protein
VVAQTGFVQGLSRGQARITATAGGANAGADVTVFALAAIELSAPTVDFTIPLGSPDPAAKTVTVTNAGDRPLGAMTVGPVSYGQGQPTGWLTPTITGAAPPFTVTLAPRVGTLTRGTYTALVPVHSAGVGNSPRNIGVTFAIQAPANIAVTPTSISTPLIPGQTKSETVNITNGGDVPLTGLTASTTYAAGQPQTWLTATLSGTTAPATLNLAINSGTLAPQTYNATVRIGSSVAGVTPRDVAVQLIVSPGPSIVLTPASPVAAFAANGTNAATQVVTISNGGGGQLTGLALGSITYGAGASNWLTLGALTPAANNTTTFTLSFNSAALPGNTVYTATLPITSPVASNSPLNLQVQLTVGPPPSLSVNPSTMPPFTGWGNGPLPGSQPVQITNSGNSTALGGLSVQISYGPGASGWLTSSFQGNVTTTPATLLLQPNTTNLNAGTYTATVTVATTAAGVASKTVSVSYTVQTFSTNIFPIISGCTGSCHSVNPPNLSASQNAQQLYNSLLPYIGNVNCKVIDPNCFHTGPKITNVTSRNALISWLAASYPFK